MKRPWILMGVGFVLVLAILVPCLLRAGQVGVAGSYQVLAPIRHGNLTIFPVVSSHSRDTSQFLTLDEGLRSGEVVVAEAGSVAPLVRPRHPHPVWQEEHADGARVNQLVLVNNSKRPLLLLAGEIVTGGKQDRIIGKDRLVPAESDPIDLSVFCVEPGRWVGSSANFKVPELHGGVRGAIVQPSVRSKAMAEKDQQQVWEEVGKSRTAMAETVEVGRGNGVDVPLQELSQTSSYARTIENFAVQGKIDEVAAPLEQDYRSVIGQLHDKNAVGVVVAVNGQIIWADVFASPRLLDKYWPKLVRSYAAESMAQPARSASVDLKAAQQFLDHLEGRREVVENEPGLYRHAEITGDGFKVFELTSLLPGTGFDLHLAKMAE
jgi:hypothetical protein